MNTVVFAVLLAVAADGSAAEPYKREAFKMFEVLMANFASRELDVTGTAGLLSAKMKWEMATADLRSECGFEDKKDLTNAIDELQRRMKVVPQEVVYVPKFTYIWTLAEARFPDELAVKMPRDDAVRELARAFLEMCGMTLVGDLSRRAGIPDVVFALVVSDAGGCPLGDG